jgi:aldose 1-epimerase
MSTFAIDAGERAGHTLVILRDNAVGSSATLVPSLGFACIGMRVSTSDGYWPVLAEPPDDEALLTRTSRYGVPIMYPYPNRIRDGVFTFAGHEYHMPIAGRGPHAIHGVTRERVWTVEASGVDDDGAFCRAAVTTGDAPDDIWPFPSQITFEYRLKGASLRMRAEAVNLGTTPMPMGFGIHPWFDVPFGPGGGSRQTMEVRAAASSFWQLDDTLCTTGTVLPAADGFDTRAWRAIGDRFIDDVYTGLALDDGWFTAGFRDPFSGRSIAVRSDGQFREHVIFAPLHAPVVCLEPYTCATDAFNLAARGIDSGMLVLEPGQRWAGDMVIDAHA